MENNALSIANYFIDLAGKNNEKIKPLRLMKLVYIAHGYILAILNKSALNKRFDRVEAWKFGPVIPSVYHSFKIYGSDDIEEKTKIFTDEYSEEIPKIEEPTLEGEEERKVCDFVWKNYRSYSGSDLVTMLHREGTPWSIVYQKGQNVEIPDELTKVYYSNLVNLLLKK